jgi:hypothetical protein
MKIVAWANLKRQRDDQKLKEIEESLKRIYDSEGGGFLSQNVDFSIS